MSEWKILPGETPIDPSGLKIKGITTRAELNRFELENITEALSEYLATRPSPKRAPFDYSWALKLHRQMFGNVWAWVGQLRTHDLNLGLPWSQVGEALYCLLGDLRTWESTGMPLIEQATHLHYRAVHIHPFENGNGRWSRLLANIWLKQNGHAIVEWPEPVRGEYIAAIKLADAGDLDPLIELHRRYVGKE